MPTTIDKINYDGKVLGISSNGGEPNWPRVMLNDAREISLNITSQSLPYRKLSLSSMILSYSTKTSKLYKKKLKIKIPR